MYTYNFIILPLYFFSIIFSLSSSSWMMIWMGMEINLLTFILIILNETENISKTESSMKYFLVQSLGSLIFLLTINMNMIYYNESSMMNAMVPPLALMLKSGMSPLHSWSPPVVSNFSSKSMFMFLTMQKLVPFFVLFSCWFWILPISSLMNIITGSLATISQPSILKMVIFSSINNIGWMMLSIMKSVALFLIFFMNYLLLSFLMIKYIFLYQIKWIIQIKSSSNKIKWLYLSLVMSFSGFPPFMGFTPKWLVIKNLHSTMIFIIILSILLSIYTMFFYLKSSLSLITCSSAMKKWNLKPQITMNLIFFTNMMGPISFFLLT
uniref:NADH dehydrogenase subunit 2 n=1 Tax=Egeirotrioza xingi TaxID=3132083 RepID=UPI0030FE15A2